MNAVRRPVGLALLVALPATTGCATVRSEYTPANGRPLAVYDREHTKIGTYDENVGSTNSVNFDGSITTTTDYVRHSYAYEVHDWYGTQGGVRVDDESFYRILRDDEAIKTYDAYHRRGVTMNHAGWLVTALGVVAVGAGYGVSAATGEKPSFFGGDTRATVEADLVGLGVIAAGVGLYLVVAGARHASTKGARLYDADGAGEHMKAALDTYERSTAEAEIPPPQPAPSPIQAPRPPATHPATGAPFVVAPFRARMKYDVVHIVEVHADGGIDLDGKAIGRFNGASIVDRAGHPLLWISADGAIGDDRSIRITDAGYFNEPDRVILGPDGTVIASSPKGTRTIGKLLKGRPGARAFFAAISVAYNRH